MKSTAFAASILAFGFVAALGAPGLTGCSATAKGVDFGDDGGSDDGGLVHADGGTHHDGSTSGGDGSTTFPDASPTGDSGTTMGCGVMTGSATCDSCLSASCCSQGQACANAPNNACLGLFQCLGGCAAGDMTCQNNCQTMNSAGVSSAQGLSHCLSTNCNTQCGGGGTTDGGTTTSDGGTGTSTCPQIVTCENNCTTQACADTCLHNGTAGAQSAFTGLIDCLFGANGTSGACGSMCGTQSTACTNCLNAAQMSGGACYTQVQTCQAN